jgi:hypothetical protein
MAVLFHKVPAVFPELSFLKKGSISNLMVFECTVMVTTYLYHTPARLV